MFEILHITIAAPYSKDKVQDLIKTKASEGWVIVSHEEMAQVCNIIFKRAAGEDYE